MPHDAFRTTFLRRTLHDFSVLDGFLSVLGLLRIRGMVLFVLASEIIECDFVEFYRKIGHPLYVFNDYLVVRMLLIVFVICN